MKILGISASRRKWGNTEILIRHVLQGAAEEGSKIRFLRLTDFDIRQCKECLHCLFKNRDCVIKDDFPSILAEIRQSDGVILGTPVHKLFAAGVLQVLIPRFFRQDFDGELAGKPGVALAVGGMPGWEGWALPQVVSFFLSLRMPLVDRFMGYGQGPGEIFYDTQACRRALMVGRALAMGEKGFIGELGSCPACHCNLIFSSDTAETHCMLCGLPGRWVEADQRKQFVPRPGAQPRWSGGMIRSHFEDLILPSGQRYHERKSEIQERLKLMQSTAVESGLS